MRYHIELTDGRAGMAAAAIAETYDGSVISTTPRFDGTRDLALIEVPAEQAEALESDLDADENVVSYRC